MSLFIYGIITVWGIVIGGLTADRVAQEQAEKDMQTFQETRRLRIGDIKEK